ncbi:MAG: hypothetical protein H7Z74_15725 [Anaerolineae bacterium]|nr:hypothetical protein [Gemmatimonadaceae bacterium]
MSDDIRREIRRLRGYCLALTAAFGVMALAAFQQASQKTKFTEIDVERINIVEPDGKLRMVISNRPRSIGPIYKGTPFGYPGGGRPGLIFFNDEGTENGGLTFTGGRGTDGKYSASSGFSFDQFDQDQILYFQYSDNNGQRRTGFTIADRAEVNIFDLIQDRDSIMKMPDNPARKAAIEKLMGPRDGVPMFAQRIYVGRDPSKNAMVNLSDKNGKLRIRMMVDSLNRPSLDFLDETGKVTHSFPEIARR